MAVPEPSRSTPTSLTENLFETMSPALAAALIAASQLSYSHSRLHTNGKDVYYVFEDPLRVGDELQRRYTAGLFPLVHAKVLAEARGYLAEEGNRLKGVARGKR